MISEGNGEETRNEGETWRKSCQEISSWSGKEKELEISCHEASTTGESCFETKKQTTGGEENEHEVRINSLPTLALSVELSVVISILISLPRFSLSFQFFFLDLLNQRV